MQLRCNGSVAQVLFWAGAISIAALGAAGDAVAGPLQDVKNRAVLKNDSIEAVIQSGMLVELKQLPGDERLLSNDPAVAFGRLPVFGPHGAVGMDQSQVVQTASSSSVDTQIVGADGTKIAIEWSIEPGNGDLVLHVSGTSSKPVNEIRYLFPGCDVSRHTAVWVDVYGVARTFHAPCKDAEIGDPARDEAPQTYIHPLITLFEGEEGGWFIEGREPNIGPATLMLQGTGQNISLGMVRSFPIATSTPQLFEVRIRAYRGQWQDAVDPYVAWMEKGGGFIPLEKHSPSWVKDIKNQAYIRIGDFDGLETLAKRVDPARTFLGRMVGAWIHPMDVGYPDYRLTDDAARWIKRARELGFHVGVHFNTFGISKDFPELIQRFRGGLEVTGKDANGNDTYFGIEGAHRHVYCSPAYRPFREYLIAQMKQAVDAGVDVIYLDESMAPCGKFLVDGETAIQGVMTLEKEIKATYPQVAIETEQFNPMESHNADFALSQMPLGHPLSGYIFHRFVNVVAEGVMGEPVDDAMMDAEESWGYMLPNAAKEESWLEIAKAFEDYDLVPDSRMPRKEFLQYRDHYSHGLLPVDDSTRSSEEDLFNFRGKDGVVAYYAKQAKKRGFVICKPGEQPQWIATRISGMMKWPGPGVLRDWVPEVGMYSDWLIYDGNTMLALDPGNTYFWDAAGKLDPNRFHLTSVPSDFAPHMDMIRRIRDQDVGRDGNWFKINFTGHGEIVAYVPDKCRAFLDGQELKPDPQSRLARVQAAADVDKPSSFVAFYRSATPLEGKWVDLPWETPPNQRSWYVARHVLDDYSADGPVRMIRDGDGFFNHVGGSGIIVGRFPQAEHIHLEGAYCMRDDSQSTVGDGVIRVNGQEVLHIHPGDRPYRIHEFDVDVSSFAGQNVLLEFGSEGEVHGPTMADWFHPQIIVDPPSASAEAK